MQQRLNNANIYRFKQLAVADPEALREALGEVGRRTKCEDWIAQAVSIIKNDERLE